MSEEEIKGGAPIPSYEDSFSVPTMASSLSEQSVVDEQATISSSCHSDSKNMYDFLPSFHMHQSLLNRSIYDGTLFSPNEPGLPIYDNDTECFCVGGPGDIGLARMASTPQAQTSNNVGLLQDSMLDNFCKLPVIRSALMVNVVLSKHPFPENKTNLQREVATKEYTNGDYLFGYYTIHNNSSNPVKFEQVVVTLEGRSTVHNSKANKDIEKVFLRIADLSAGFCPGRLPISPHSESELYRFETDAFGYKLYLPDDQILEPGQKYRKFFTFRFPNQLLDQSCDDEQLAHLVLPPSFGITRMDRKNIVYNNRLGYGRTDEPGCAFLMKDNAPINTSIDYAVCVRIIGSNPKMQDDVRYSIVGNARHNLRFIPTGSCERSSFDLTTMQQLDQIYKEIRLELIESKNRLTGESDSIMTEPISTPTTEKSFELDTVPVLNQLTYLEGLTSKLRPSTTSLTLLESVGNLLKKTFKEKGTVEVSSASLSNDLSYIVPNIFRRLTLESRMDGRKVNSSNSNSKQSIKIDLDLKFTPLRNDIKPPAVDSITCELVIVSMVATAPIPFTVDDTFFLSATNNRILQEEFGHFSNDFKALGPTATIKKRILSNLNSILSLTVIPKILPFFKITDKEVSTWNPVMESEKIVWNSKVRFNAEVNSLIDLTLIPNFQSCYISRFYYVKVQVAFKKSGLVTLHLPLRVKLPEASSA